MGAQTLANIVNQGAVKDNSLPTERTKRDIGSEASRTLDPWQISTREQTITTEYNYLLSGRQRRSTDKERDSKVHQGGLSRVAVQNQAYRQEI